MALREYREAMRAWRMEEASRMRDRQKKKAKPEPVDPMDLTTWSQWYRNKNEYQRYLRTRRDREIRAVYWSEVRPKYFRNTLSLNPKLMNQLEADNMDKSPRDFYVIAKLLKAA